MKKITRENLGQLAKIMPVLSANEQRTYWGGSGIDTPINGGELPEVVIMGYSLTRPDGISGDSKYFAWYDSSYKYFYPDKTLGGVVVDKVTGKLLGPWKDMADAVTNNQQQVSYILSRSNYPSGEPFGVFTDGFGQMHIYGRNGSELGQIDRWTQKIY